MEVRDNNFFHIMTTAITFILGKVKELDTLHVVRHIQSPLGRKVFNKNHPESRNTYWWLTGNQWNDNLAVLQQSIVNDLMKIDGLSSEKAQEIYESCFFMYYSMYFANKTYSDTNLRKFYEKYYTSSLFYLGNEIVDDILIKGIRYFYPRIRLSLEKFRHRIIGGEVLESNILNKSTKILLPSLLREKSKYHKSFMPVYESITNHPKNHKL